MVALIVIVIVIIIIIIIIKRESLFLWSFLDPAEEKLLDIVRPPLAVAELLRFYLEIHG